MQSIGDDHNAVGCIIMSSLVHEPDKISDIIPVSPEMNKIEVLFPKAYLVEI